MLVAVFDLLHNLAVNHIRISFLINVCQHLILLDSRELLTVGVVEVAVFFMTFLHLLIVI